MPPHPSSPVLLVALLAASSLLAGCVEEPEEQTRLVAAGDVESGGTLWAFGDDHFQRENGTEPRTIMSSFRIDPATTPRFSVHLSGTLSGDDSGITLRLEPTEGDADPLVLDAKEGGPDDYGTIRTFFAFDRAVDAARSERAGDGPSNGTDDRRWNITLSGEDGVGTVKVEIRTFSTAQAVTDGTFRLDKENMTTGRLRITVAADGAGDPPRAGLYGPDVHPVADLMLEDSQDSTATVVVVDTPGDLTLRIHHGGFAGTVQWRVDEIVSS